MVRSNVFKSVGMLPKRKNVAPADTKLGKNDIIGRVIKNASENMDIHFIFWVYARIASVKTFMIEYLMHNI